MVILKRRSRYLRRTRAAYREGGAGRPQCYDADLAPVKDETGTSGTGHDVDGVPVLVTMGWRQLAEFAVPVGGEDQAIAGKMA